MYRRLSELTSFQSLVARLRQWCASSTITRSHGDDAIAWGRRPVRANDVETNTRSCDCQNSSRLLVTVPVIHDFGIWRYRNDSAGFDLRDGLH